MSSWGSILCITLLTLSVSAQERPSWINNPPPQDSMYKYYVGRAFGESSELKALDSARINAQNAAIRENFGYTASGSLDTVESELEFSIDKRVQEELPKVVMAGFEFIEQYVESGTSGINLWVLYKYKKSEILKEQKRLSTNAPIKAEMSETGQASIQHRTELVVSTNPPGAEVFIDNIRWGLTPLKLRGVIPPGRRMVEIKTTSFKDVSEVVVVGALPKKLKYNLSKAVGTANIRIMSELRRGFIGASLTVNGKSYGAIRELKIENLEVGKSHTVIAENPYFHKLEMKIAVEKDVIQDYELVLKFNEKGRALIAKFEKERKELEAQRELASEPVQQTYSNDMLDDLYSPYGSSFVFGIPFGMSNMVVPESLGGATYKIGASLEKRFLKRLGIRLTSNYEALISPKLIGDYSEGNFQISGNTVGIPIYSTGENKGFYIMPEIGNFNFKGSIRTEDEFDYSSTSENFNIPAKYQGVKIGFYEYQESFEAFISFGNFSFSNYGNDYQQISFGLSYISASD